MGRDIMWPIGDAGGLAWPITVRCPLEAEAFPAPPDFRVLTEAGVGAGAGGVLLVGVASMVGDAFTGVGVTAVG